MTQRTAVRKEGNTLIHSERVFRGYQPQQAYTPVQKPLKEVITNREYIRMYGVGKPAVIQDVMRTVRQRQLLQQVVNCRKAIRNTAERLRLDKYTTITAVTSTQKTLLHSHKLMSILAKQIVS